MRKAWVLDTETKGTGAEMVPLDKVLKKPADAGRGIILPRERVPRPPKAQAPKQPPRFRVVDVMTRQVLADDADTRTAVEALRGVRSVVDVSVYAWDQATESWKALGIADRRKLLSLASSLPVEA